MSPGALGPDEGRALVAIARAAIASALGRSEAPAVEITPALAQPLGVFVTLTTRVDHGLRGCVGFVEARRPVAEAVAEAARAAAFRDTRFEPLRAAELPGLAFEVSVLSRPEPMAPEAIVVGVHGLILRRGGRSGLLLPQVPIEHGWGRDAFLEALCRKAGLPKDAWRAGDAELLGFTAQVFDDET